MNKIFLLTLTILLMCGCSYNELPPKTDDITNEYVLPKGVKPTQSEMDAVTAAKAEYESSIKN